jgi:hypothetical protein
MENVMLKAEIALRAVATDLAHVLEPFVARQSRPDIGDTWKRSVCVNCATVWDVRWSPITDLIWGIVKIEQPNRRLSRDDEDGEVPEPVPMRFDCLPPSCEEVRMAGFGVWSFRLDSAPEEVCGQPPPKEQH